MKKIIAVIQARLNSVRLPEKVMLPILGKPMVFYIIERLKSLKDIDQIVLATSGREINAKLIKYAKENGLGVFSHSNADDICSRLYKTCEYFNSNLGIINKDSHNILSNIIYDIVFDDYGNVFIATEMGISILETSFNRKNNENNIGVSPNPFIIGEDSEIIFSNVSSDAIIKVISLNGSILKTFNMEDYSRNVKWNGKSDNGRKIPSGIYLLSSYDRNLGSKTTKLAIINK